MITSIYQEVELSLTENLIPVTVPVKQYDNKARKVRCVLYNNSVQYSVPQDCIVACSGTRPDGFRWMLLCSAQQVMSLARSPSH